VRNEAQKVIGESNELLLRGPTVVKVLNLANSTPKQGPVSELCIALSHRKGLRSVDRISDRIGDPVVDEVEP